MWNEMKKDLSIKEIIRNLNVSYQKYKKEWIKNNVQCQVFLSQYIGLRAINI